MKFLILFLFLATVAYADKTKPAQIDALSKSCVRVNSLTGAFDNYAFAATNQAMTAKSVSCYCFNDCSDPPVITVEHLNGIAVVYVGGATTITCQTAGLVVRLAVDQTNISRSFGADDVIRFDTGDPQTGNPDILLCINYELQ